MTRDETDHSGVLGACLFCGLSVLSIGGWTYMFLNESYPNLSRLGETLAIALGIGLAPVWIMAAMFVTVLVVNRQWKPRPAWIVACLLTGIAGGLATFMGWAVYLGPAV